MINFFRLDSSLLNDRSFVKIIRLSDRRPGIVIYLRFVYFTFLTLF